jgi:hypothetical protein
MKKDDKISCCWNRFAVHSKHNVREVFSLCSLDARLNRRSFVLCLSSKHSKKNKMKNCSSLTGEITMSTVFKAHEPVPTLAVKWFQKL